MSQATRSITYGSTQGGENSSGQTFSAAATWGQLKEEEPKIGALAISGMNALIKYAGQSINLTSDSQTLPAGDFTLYFVMSKNNSGRGNN